MLAAPQNVPIVPIFVPMLFQNGCSIHSNRAQFRRPKVATISTKRPLVFLL